LPGGNMAGGGTFKKSWATFFVNASLLAKHFALLIVKPYICNAMQRLFLIRLFAAHLANDGIVFIYNIDEFIMNEHIQNRVLL
jgi:hypothetical protein